MRLVNRQVPSQLIVIEEAHTLFDRSDEIDQEEQKKVSVQMEWDAGAGRAKEVRRGGWFGGGRRVLCKDPPPPDPCYPPFPPT